MPDFNQITFKQGDDVAVNIPILDSKNYPVDISVCNAIRANLRVNNNEVYQYSLVSTPGMGVIEVDGTYNNIMKLLLQRDETKTFTIGNVSVVVVLQFPDASMPSGFRSIEESFNIGAIKAGFLKSQQL